MTPPPPPDIIDSLWPVLTTGVIIFVIYALRQLHIALNQTHEQQVRTEAQRLMLCFCKNPTQKNFNTAWAYIDEHDVWVTELDQPLVQRFRSLSNVKGIK